MEYTFDNKHLTVWTRSHALQIYGIGVKHPVLFRKLNKVLESYDKKSKMARGEEPQFFVNIAKLTTLAANSGIVGKHARIILRGIRAYTKSELKQR